MNKKNITIVSAYYYPEETAIGLYNTQLTDFLVQKGYNVKIITGFPNYPQWKIHQSYKDLPSYYTETLSDVEVIRYKQYVPNIVNFKGRVLLMLSLFYGTFRNIFKIKKSDLVICVLPFSINMITAKFLSKRMKAKFWVHVQDFEFDLALDSGVVKQSNLFFKFFKKTLSFFESKMLNSADIVSSISNSMLKKVKEKSHHTDPFYFPNWVSSDKINPSICSKHKLVNTDMFTVLYSGNIGEKQNWLFLENLCELVKETDAIEIIIVGDGAYKNNLKKQLEKFNFVTFFDPVPYEELNDLLCSVDVHFLFQKNEVIDTVMPSKLLAMMASAKPSIITGNKESEVAFIINESKGGYYFSDDNVLSVYNQIIDLKKSPEIGLEIGNNARSYVLDRFSSNKVLNDFNDKLLSVLNG